MRASPGPAEPGAGGEMPGSPVDTPQDKEVGQLMENDYKWEVNKVPPTHMAVLNMVPEQTRNTAMESSHAPLDLANISLLAALS